MKYLCMIAALGGIAATILAFIVVLTQKYLMGVTGAGYLRGASVLFLLSLVIMVYDRAYLKGK